MCVCVLMSGDFCCICLLCRLVACLPCLVVACTSCCMYVLLHACLVARIPLLHVACTSCCTYLLLHVCLVACMSSGMCVLLHYCCMCVLLHAWLSRCTFFFLHYCSRTLATISVACVRTFVTCTYSHAYTHTYGKQGCL